MGIQDRDYYRNEGPSVFDSLMPKGIVCRWLIAINVVLFLAQTFPGDVAEWLILDTRKVVDGQVWRLLSFAFLHADFWHILFNMLFLWWFGSDVEQLYGRKEFLAIYLCSALAGGIAYEGWSLAQGVSNNCLGASGAVTTMLVLCALHFPRRIIYVWFLPMPIWAFAVLSVARDFILFVAPIKTDVAVVVHLTGALFAVGYYKWQQNITDILRSLRWWRTGGARARLKIFQPDLDQEEPLAVSATAAAPRAAMDEHLEAKLDALLEKIAQKGKDSLTKQEEEILKQASEMYKRRRS